MISLSKRNFWIAQLIGWSLVGLSNFALQSFLSLPLSLQLMNALTPIVSGLMVTTAYRYFIRRYRWPHWSVGKIIGLLLLSSLVNTLTFILLVAIMFRLLSDVRFGVVVFASNFLIFFVVLLCWNVIYLLIHYLHYWHRAEVEKWQLANDVKDAQLSALRSQINPHFVFNAINNIRSLIREDPSRARDMLLHFSALFRYALNHSERDTVTLGQELDMVRQYLELAALQYEEKLRFQITADECLYSYPIPLMSLQMLVENAIKHGIAQHPGGGEVQITVRKTNATLHLCVRNTGRLSTPTALDRKEGVGLSNIRRRLQLVYDEQASFSIRQEDNTVLASVKIPVL